MHGFVNSFLLNFFPAAFFFGTLLKNKLLIILRHASLNSVKHDNEDFIQEMILLNIYATDDIIII